MNNTNAYIAILEKCIELGLPKRFTGDVIRHDKACLAEAPERTLFLWAVEESSTHIMRFSRDSDLAANLKHVEAVLSSYPDAQWFYWNDTTLLPVRRWEATEVARNLHECAMMRQAV